MPDFLVYTLRVTNTGSSFSKQKGDLLPHHPARPHLELNQNALTALKRNSHPHLHSARSAETAQSRVYHVYVAILF